MGKKRAPLGGSRRSRLDISETADDDPALDPIAAATAAKAKRQEEILKAASAAAAKAAGANISTVFFDETPSTTLSTQEGRAPAPKFMQNSRETKFPENPKLPEEDTNPLAALLGYSPDGATDSEDEQERRIEKEAVAEPKENLQAPQGNGNRGKDELDAELASFMEELESDGLLRDEPATTSDEQPAVEASSSSPAPAVEGPLPQPADSALPHLAVASESGPDSTAQQSVDTPTSPGEDAVAPEAAQAGPAEQRVLGELQSAPDWFEVMDMASRKVYFWNSTTNEVAWEPPPGSVPRTQAEKDAAAAEGAVVAEPAEPLPHATQPGVKDEPEATATTQQPAAPDDGLVAVGEATGGAVSEEAAAVGAEDDGGVPAAELSEEMEDGQVLPAEDSAASIAPAETTAAAPAAQPSIPQPSADVEASGEALVWRLREAVAQLCGPVPRLVWLAVEAEVRHRDWQAFAAAQRAAAAAGDAAGSLSWERFEAAAAERMAGLDAEVTEALQEAERTRAEAEASGAEEGEVPIEEPLGPAKLPSAQLQEAPPSSPAAKEASPGPGPPPPDDMELDLDTADVPAAPAGTVASEAAAAHPPVASYALPQHSHFPISLAPPLAAWSQYDAAMPRPLPGFPAYPPRIPYMYPPPYHPMAYPHVAQPPLPQDAAVAQPPLPADQDAGTPAAAQTPPLPPEQQSEPQQVSEPHEPAVLPPEALLSSAKRKEYFSEPVRVGAVAEAPTVRYPLQPEYEEAVEAPAAPGVLAAAEKEKSRKRERVPVGTGLLGAKKKTKAAKSTSTLINKWQAVRATVEQEERREAAAEEETPEEKRVREAEAWRLKQLREGNTDNANFQPLAMDWRERLAKRRQQEKGESAEDVKASAAPADQAADKERPNLKALSKGLPAGWKAFWDKSSGDVYYGNLETKETSWERPT